MRKDTVHYQVWKPECLQDLLPVFRQDAQRYPRVQGQMDMDTPPSGCQGPPVVISATVWVRCHRVKSGASSGEV